MRGFCKKTILLPILAVFVIALASAGCEVLPTQQGGEPIGTGPIDAGWVPTYIVEEAGEPVDPRDMVASVGSSVVAITSQMESGNFFLPTPERGAGTGIIIDPAGYIVTNYHVVDGADTLRVTLSDGRVFEAREWVGDREADIAVVAVDADTELPRATFLRDSLDKLYVPEPVWAAGNALALPGGPTWTEGVVSNLGRPIRVAEDIVLEDTIQTSAAINPGNSGGPLLNQAGQVVGINTAIAQEAEGIGFAISTDQAIPVINRLIGG